MRIWDIKLEVLCNKHLVALHRELHGCYNIVTVHSCKGGYSRHPETIRWYGKAAALRIMHNNIVIEAAKRQLKMGIAHLTPIDKNNDGESNCEIQTQYVDTPSRQIEILMTKPCTCRNNIKQLNLSDYSN